uniref:Uncharacterized protein n=1 Tax=Triticum urartu TaxID=4572 RepID=A0A8R7UBY6_TRIUA
PPDLEAPGQISSSIPRRASLCPGLLAVTQLAADLASPYSPRLPCTSLATRSSDEQAILCLLLKLTSWDCLFLLANGFVVQDLYKNFLDAWIVLC